MASAIKQYKNLKTIDKIVIPVALVVLIGVASFFAEDVNPLTTILGFIAFYTFVHFTITRAASTAALVVLLMQVIVFTPVIMAYGMLASSSGTMDGQSSLVAGALYTTAATYLTAWATWRWSAGRWWIRLLLGFVAIDILAPLAAVGTGLMNLYFPMAVGAALVTMLCIPWSRIRANPAVDMPTNVKSDNATQAVRGLIEALDGVNVSDSEGIASDFIADNGNYRFHVSVLGKDRNIKVSGNSVQYGSANLKPLLFQMTQEASKKKDIPVVVNYSDTSKSFVEIQSSLKADKRRGRHVIMTTPRKLVDLLKEQR